MSGTLITIKNNNILEALKEKGNIIEDGKALVEKMEEMDKELQTKNLLIQKIVEKIKPIVEKEVKDNYEMGEFDVINEVKINGDQVEIVILNEIEEFEKYKREEKSKKLELNKK